MMNPGRSMFLLSIGLLVVAPPVARAESLRAAAPGQVVQAPSGRGTMESLTIEERLAPTLLQVPLEGSIEVADWPVAPGKRESVLLTRHEIYAADARLVAMDAGREVELPRSNLVFFWGDGLGPNGSRVLVSIDPDSGLVGGTSLSALGTYDLLAPNAKRAEHLLTSEPEGQSGAFECDVDTLPSSPRPATHRDAAVGPEPAAFTSLHTAVLAFDTDNELLSLKFLDNTTAATNYVASVVAQLNIIYERDLFVRILQGFTILRPSTTPDPYVATESNAAKLDEFRSYWNANYGSIPRAATAMLSGKSPSLNSASGRSAVSALCNRQGAYSFNNVFRNPANPTATASDGRLIGHELGHNFGSSHTHNTDTNLDLPGVQPIDFCVEDSNWNPLQPVSCPAPFDITTASGAVVPGVRGTLMSYCNMLSGCTHTGVFHPLSISLAITPYLDGSGQCLLPLTSNPAPVVSSVSPGSGPTNGGTSVTIDGSNFRSPATVTFADLGGAKAATSVTVVSPTRITATTPAHTAGAKNVLVHNPDQTSGALASAFTFVGSPGRFFALSPCRIIDTRYATGTLGGPALVPSAVRQFALVGSCGVPPSAKALSVNLTVTGATAAGYVTLYPADGSAPLTSSVNFLAGETRANNAMVAVSTAGTAGLAVQNGSTGDVHLILDVNGYFE